MTASKLALIVLALMGLSSCQSTKTTTRTTTTSGGPLGAVGGGNTVTVVEEPAIDPETARFYDTVDSLLNTSFE